MAPRSHDAAPASNPMAAIIEVAFNGIQKSERHASGYALRFPRIVRIRHDKTLPEIDTLDTVEKIFRISRQLEE